jgi:DGQHR domain-containing protein
VAPDRRRIAVALIAKKKPKAKKKKKLSAEERRTRAAQRAFANVVRTVFERCGFRRLSGVNGKEFVFEGIKSEFDDAFKFENVVVLVEHTLSKAENVGPHLKAKAHLYERIRKEPSKFLEVLSGVVPAVKEALEDDYISDQRIVRILYASKSEVKSEHQQLAPDVAFLAQAGLRYFHKLASTLKKSARFELFDFLGVNPTDVGIDGVVKSGVEASTYQGSVLPEGHSNFPTGYKVVSFYVDPGSVLKRAYVLRRDGWKDSLSMYQRMIIPKKIASIRKYLREKHRVFANNVVVTLPDDTELLGLDGKPINHKDLKRTSPVGIRIPDRANSIGIIDGQHRIFSYYEDTSADALIDKYRSQQNLLATGIVYPPGTADDDKERFEARLFLEINSNQAAAKSDLKQAISLILEPFDTLSIARRVVQELSESGPLDGILERNLFDAGKLKTTTIVSYGMQPLVKLGGTDSLFHIWNDPSKDTLKDKSSTELLDKYVSFAVDHIRDFLILAKGALGPKWALRTKDGPGVLTVTSVNGLLILMRNLIASGELDATKLHVALTPLSGIDFTAAKSSQYAALAAKLHTAVSKKPKAAATE